MSTKGKSAATGGGRSRASKSAAKPRTPAKPRTTAARTRSTPSHAAADTGQAPGWLLDIVVLALLAVAAFTTVAAYDPGFSAPFGSIVHDALYAAFGAGMYVLPAAALLLPFTLLPGRYRRPLLKGLAWAACLTLLATLFAGLYQAGGVVGDSAATAGQSRLGRFYAILLGVLAVIVIIRLAGRSLLVPLLRGTMRAAASTAESVRDLSDAVKEEAGALAQQRVQREAAREARRRAVLAAELEAADAPEGESPVLREAGRAAFPPAGKGEHGQDARAANPPSAPPTGPPAPPGMPARFDVPEPPPEITPLALADQPPAVDEFAQVIAHAEPAAPQADACATESPAGTPAPLHIIPAPPTALREPAKDAPCPAGQLPLFDSTQAGYELPPLDLLRDAPRTAGEEPHLSERSRIIEQTLANFNIEARCVAAITGPRVTRYELTIGPGINVSKVHALADNLALELAVKAVRIEAPVPGKSVVGIEVPNAAPDLVTLKSVLLSPLSQRANHPLTVGLGRDIAGQAVIANLAKMPHLLVAGATGSGKSVCLNAVIVSLLLRNAPDTLRLLLIDPKRVEMTSYLGLPQLACPVVHDVHQAQNALKWAVAEMDRRYRLLEAARARNIAAYNEQAALDRQLPYIVIVVDELADLMMLAGQVIEKLICRIAQLSRAVGIHLVIATQRPDVKVITGTIKANIPSRVAFAVVSQIDSRTILDGGGAEKLLGSGDMLFAPIGENVPLRVQGAFLGDDEIDRVVAWCRAQSPPLYDESIVSFAADGESGGGGAGGNGRDELFDEAREIVTSMGRASISYLQRRLKVGYNRAANLMEELEAAGIVSEPDSQGNRKVL